MPLNLNIPQFEFYSMTKAFRAFVGGYRSGKTFLGCARLCALALEYPGIKLGYFAPTYPQVRDIFYSTIVEVAELIGMEADIRVGVNEVDLYYYGDLHTTIKCRSMEHPQRIVGFDLNHALIDEIDCMKREKADQAWKKIIARLSSPGFDEARLYDEECDMELVIDALDDNTVDFTTTPEGFNWVYDFFVRQPKDKPELREYYGIVHASTEKNAKNLAKGYIDKLRATYPANLIDAYIAGKFVNLTGGTVYRQFNDELNHSDITDNGNEDLHIGMDFNVGKMSAIVHVEREGLPIAVNEILGRLDTPDMIDEINRLYPDRYIEIYPDSSGKNREAVDASETDISKLHDQGWRVIYDTVNPRVRDRINAMNAMFCNGLDERKYLVNTHLCPQYTSDLQQQIYNKQGEPDKDHNTDHANDAAGYYIAMKYPIIRPITRRQTEWRR